MSPILLHGFAVGRPDHQSLVLLLTGSGILAETVLWTKRGLWTSVWWGLSWGCALWVSWFEPLVLLVLVLIVGFWFGAANAWRGHGCPRLAWLRLFSTPSLLEGLPELGLGGMRAPIFSVGDTDRRAAVLSTRSLQRSPGLAGCPCFFRFPWHGWYGSAAKSSAWLWLTLLLSMGALTGGTPAGDTFLHLSGALAMPSVLAIIRQRWLGYSLFVVSLWPVASFWRENCFPKGRQRAGTCENLRESQQLREAAEAIKDLEGDGVLAPWWLTPQFVYWSGQIRRRGNFPRESGRNSRLRLSSLLRRMTRKQVGPSRRGTRTFVVVCDADRLLDNSYTVLGRKGQFYQPTRSHPLPDPVPCPQLPAPCFQNPSFKVYRVRKRCSRRVPSPPICNHVTFIIIISIYFIFRALGSYDCCDSRVGSSIEIGSNLFQSLSRQGTKRLRLGGRRIPF